MIPRTNFYLDNFERDNMVSRRGDPHPPDVTKVTSLSKKRSLLDSIRDAVERRPSARLRHWLIEVGGHCEIDMHEYTAHRRSISDMIQGALK